MLAHFSDELILKAEFDVNFVSCSITTTQDSATFKAIPKKMFKKSFLVRELFNGSYCLLAGLSNKGYKSEFDNLFLNLRNLFFYIILD